MEHPLIFPDACIVIQKAREGFYSRPDADRRYEDSYVLGCMEVKYQMLADKLKKEESTNAYLREQLRIIMNICDYAEDVRRTAKEAIIKTSKAPIPL